MSDPADAVGVCAVLRHLGLGWRYVVETPCRVAPEWVQVVPIRGLRPDARCTDGADAGHEDGPDRGSEVQAAGRARTLDPRRSRAVLAGAALRRDRRRQAAARPGLVGLGARGSARRHRRQPRPASQRRHAHRRGSRPRHARRAPRGDRRDPRSGLARSADDRQGLLEAHAQAGPHHPESAGGGDRPAQVDRHRRAADRRAPPQGAAEGVRRQHGPPDDDGLRQHLEQVGAAARDRRPTARLHGLLPAPAEDGAGRSRLPRQGQDDPVGG